jgi:hypothetical protein
MSYRLTTRFLPTTPDSAALEGSLVAGRTAAGRRRAAGRRKVAGRTVAVLAAVSRTGTPHVMAGVGRTAVGPAAAYRMAAPRPMAGPGQAVTTGRTATPAPSTAAGQAETPRSAGTRRLATGADRTAAAGHAPRVPHPRAPTNQTWPPHPTGAADRTATLRRQTAATPAPDSTRTPRPTGAADRMATLRRPTVADPAAPPHPTAVTAGRSAQSWASRSPGDGFVSRQHG